MNEVLELLVWIGCWAAILTLAGLIADSWPD